MLYEWIKQNAEKPWMFHVNANAAYPLVMSEIGVSGQPTQYDLEFAHNVIKLDARMAIKMAAPELDMPTIIIEGDDDAVNDAGQPAHKAQWGIQHAPPGKLADLRESNQDAWDRQVTADARAWYKTARGYMPA